MPGYNVTWKHFTPATPLVGRKTSIFHLSPFCADFDCRGDKGEINEGVPRKNSGILYDIYTESPTRIFLISLSPDLEFSKEYLIPISQVLSLRDVLPLPRDP